MKKSFKVLFYLKRPQNYKKESFPIYVRLTVDGERVEWSAQRECEPDRWNNLAGRVNGTRQDARAVNAWLEQVNAQVFEVQRELMGIGKKITAVAIRNKIHGTEEAEKVHEILSVYRYHNEQFAELVGKDFAFGTLKKFRTAFASL